MRKGCRDGLGKLGGDFHEARRRQRLVEHGLLDLRVALLSACAAHDEAQLVVESSCALRTALPTLRSAGRCCQGDGQLAVVAPVSADTQEELGHRADVQVLLVDGGAAGSVWKLNTERAVPTRAGAALRALWRRDVSPTASGLRGSDGI